MLAAARSNWSAALLALRHKQREAEAAAERKAEEARVRDTRPSLAPVSYAGRYTAALYGDATVDEDGGMLTLSLLPSGPLLCGRLEHWHFDTFTVRFEDRSLPRGFVTFGLDAHGAVAEMRIDVPNPDFNFRELEFKRVP